MPIEDRKQIDVAALCEELRGLNPRAWVCVGAGVSREDLKAVLLERGTGFAGHSILSTQSLCTTIVGALAGRASVAPDRILGGTSRQEVLRVLLTKGGSARYPELSRLKRQRTFFRKLDRAIQGGRLVAAHAEERGAMDARLEQRFGPSPLRAELEALVYEYESWVVKNSLWDPPLLMKTAALALNEGWPEGLTCPETIYLFTAQHPESLELEFWESVSSRVQVVRAGLPEPVGVAASAAESTPSLDWQKWHTLDDAAEGLAQFLSSEADLSRHVVLVPDVPAMRRSVMRAFHDWGIPLSDPRDPTRLRWEEAIKASLLPLEVVARDFPREKVIAYLQSLRGTLSPEEIADLVKEIHSRGIRRGLSSYSGGRLTRAHGILTRLEQRLGGRQDASRASVAHLKFLSESLVKDQGMSNEGVAWVMPFFEAQWAALIMDLRRLGKVSRGAPALFWLERLQARVSEATPPVQRFKPAHGVRLHRLQQVPVEAFLSAESIPDLKGDGRATGTSKETLWLFGVPAQWLGGDGAGAGDYWYSDRERELLASEFAVRSGARVREERLHALRARFSLAAEVRVLDAHYDWNGKERQSLGTFLIESGLIDADSEFAPVELGAHLRWKSSFGAERPLQPQAFSLPSLNQGGAEARVSSTVLDKYSACAFQGLASGRWKLYDLRDPGAELWPDVRGRILHKAVELLLRSPREDGRFTLGVDEALERAWSEEQPRGLIQGARSASMMKRRLKSVLETFLEKEQEYFERAGTSVFSLEQDVAFEMTFPELPGVMVRGQADRIDENDDGLFVIDYKTGSSQPAGRDMIEEGYRLQLPFYALAAREKFGREVLGVQFVELNRKGGRSRGIFLKRYNGKASGCLTKTTARSASLIDASPDEVWSRCREQVVSHLRELAGGSFAACPKKPIECQGCSYGDLCGRRRCVGDGDAGAANGGAASGER